MKWFYIISVGLVAAMSAAPFLLLDREDNFAKPGEVVAYGIYAAKIKSLDPATCGDTSSAELQGNFYESLYAYSFLKRPVEVVPQLATAMPEVSADQLTYTFKIRPGIKYHRNECFGRDETGQPKTRTVTADDFVLAFKRIADYHVSTDLSLAFVQDKIVGMDAFRERTKNYDKGDFSRYWKEDLEGVKAIDEQTLQIKLTVPFPQLIYVLAINCYAPIPREVVEYWLSSRAAGSGREDIPLKDRNPEITDYHACVGTGAYYLEKYVDGGTNILRRNPDFRPETYPCDGSEADRQAGLMDDCGKPVPLVDVIHQRYVPEDNPMWLMFLTKQIDVSGIPRDVYTQVITPGRDLTDAWAKQGIVLKKYTSPAVFWLAFNNEDRVLGASRSLRQALCLAFDVEQFIEVLANGRGIRALNTLPSSFEAFKEAGPSPYARFDLAAAKVKLQDARRELVAAGVIGPDDPIPALTLDLGGQSEDARREGEFVLQQFKQIGINLKVELNDWPTQQTKVRNKQTQIYAMGWHADYPDPENFLQLYYTPNIKRGTNNCNYSNPEFDKLYEQVAKMQPSPERTSIYVKMVRMLNEDCPVLLLTEPQSFVLIHDWVHNVNPHPFGYGFAKYRGIDAALRQKEGGL